REVIGSATRECIRVQLIGLSAEASDALHPLIERRLHLVDRALYLARLRSFATQTFELLVDDLQQLRGRMAGASGGDDLELAAECARLLIRRHVLGNLHVVDETLVESRVLAACEHRRRDVE